MPAESQEISPAPRYLVGIDLGTTNCAVCYIDSLNSGREVETFPIPQVVAPGQVAALDTLPSFLYLPAAHEFPEGSLNLPWTSAASETTNSQITGAFARDHGRLSPGRSIESAKSWLCHPGVDRTSALLPWRGGDDTPRLSPVQASAAYLAHIRAAWNDAHPDAFLENQDLVLTLPASFDEVARELTIAAAKAAGLPRVWLIEEPQAAFYAWLKAHAENWPALVSPGQNILVCDIGGGTTDFTLIRVRAQTDGTVQFQRVAVGEHLILGGDNLDLALAHHLEERTPGVKPLPPRIWGALVRSCRAVKERLLSENAAAEETIVLPGTGARLVGGAQSITVTRSEAEQVLLEGFFPPVAQAARPRAQTSGFQEFGLPYAPDPAITRYLAAFLSDHLSQPLPTSAADAKATSPPATPSARPDLVLFNGGVFVSPLIRQRVLDVLADWYRGEDPDWRPSLLANDRHDLAVARGAAYYGLVRRGEGVRIAAGLPRSYYVGVGQQHTDHPLALCLAPAGLEPGEEIALAQHDFQLKVAQPVEFPLFHSSLRLTDPPGALIVSDREQLTPLPPIRTVLRTGRNVSDTTLAVQLHAKLTEIGTLQVWCAERSGPRSWQLQFDVRAATQTALTGHAGAGESEGVLDEAAVERVRDLLRSAFSTSPEITPGRLMKQIARDLSLSREQWPPALLRRMWDTLIEVEAGRRRSPEHEARWLNLVGYALRPGYGIALDDWRVQETWKLLRGKLQFSNAATLAEWWILWRRIGGGLQAGQQLALAEPILTRLREDRRHAQRGKAGRRTGVPADQAESWRFLGSMERLSVSKKQELGDWAIALITQPENSGLAGALLFAIGRVGARVPLYGPLNETVSPEVSERWLDQLCRLSIPTGEHELAVMQLARRTGDRHRDLSDAARRQAAKWLRERKASETFVELVEQGGELASQTQSQLFGDSLPLGLSIRN